MLTDQCPDFPLECVNDGYLTLVNGKCACLCPAGLDPKDGCASVLGDRMFLLLFSIIFIVYISLFTSRIMIY